MAKLTLSSILASFGSIAKLNSNFQAITTAFENTLSRDGTAPNSMNAALDMNSQRIMNLPAPVGQSDAVRYVDIQAGLVSGSFAIPALTGNSGKFLTNDGTVVSWATTNLTSTPTFTTLTVTAATSLNTFTTTGNGAVGGALSVTGAFTGTSAALSSNVTVGGSLGVSGATTLVGNGLTVGTTQLVAASGRIGIGTASPSTMLHLVGQGTFAGSAATPVVAVTCATTTVVDCTLGNIFTMPMSTNVTTLTMSNPSSGQTVNIVFTQDGTGSRVITWPANFKWSGGTAAALSTAATKVDLLVATWIPSAAIWIVALTKDFR